VLGRVFGKVISAGKRGFLRPEKGGFRGITDVSIDAFGASVMLVVGSVFGLVSGIGNSGRQCPEGVIHGVSAARWRKGKPCLECLIPDVQLNPPVILPVALSPWLVRHGCARFVGRAPARSHPQDAARVESFLCPEWSFETLVLKPPAILWMVLTVTWASAGEARFIAGQDWHDHAQTKRSSMDPG
jgi:hypothetical protein